MKGNASISGELKNEGLIEAGPAGGNDPINAPVKAGISLEGNSIVGSTLKGITNTGIIRVLANIEHNGEPFWEGAQANGIQVIENAVAGRIENHGEIIADTYGIYVDDTTIDGGIVNAEEGKISTGDNGIYLKDAHVKGSLINSGSIVSEFDNAIDIEDSIIDSDIVINGSLTANENYDALSIDDSFIAGNVTTGSSLLTSNPTLVTITGEDGLDIDDTFIVGAVDSSANISVVSEGVDFDETFVGGDFTNSGNITAGGTGISFEGDYIQPPAPPEEPDPMPMMAEPQPPKYSAAIGGNFENAGAIHAGENGIDLNRISVAGSFENYGEIHAETGVAITLSAMDIGQDFINQGDLFADVEPRYGVGESYDQPWGGEPSENGSMVLESLGVDEHGQVWYRIRNEGPMMQGVQLSDPEGDFISGELVLSSGDQIVINAGLYSGEEQTFILTDPMGEGEPLTEVGAINQPFIAQVIEATQQGISLVGDYYDDGDLELESQVTIGGRFVNTGDIRAVDEGIYVTGTTVGADFGNNGDITSLTSAGIALVDDVMITGNFNNTATITSAEEGIIFEGERWLDGESGAVITDTVAQVGTFMNQGTINAGSTGIDIYDADIAGAFINSCYAPEEICHAVAHEKRAV